MSLKSLFLCGSSLAIGLAAILLGSFQGDENKPVVLRREFQALQLEFFNNSPTMSQALGMNSSGSIIGFKEDPKNFKHVYFYCGQGSCKDMPIPKGFTNVEAIAISDTEMVVGRTTKAIGTEGSLRAVIWSPGRAEIELLPTPDGDGIADATDVTPDGRRITGYATGSGRLRPVVWDWDPTKSSWQVEVLPTIHASNPYLMSSQLVVSPDGNTIVGCCTESFLPDGTVNSALYEWRKVDGKWTRRLVTEEQMYVKAINNKGQIAGSLLGGQGRLPCLVTLDGKIQRLDLLEGDVAGEARDINEDSIIVGWSDDPPGTDGGPMPCVWKADGQASRLQVSQPGYGMLFAVNGKGQMAGTAEVITKAATSDTANDAEAAMLAVRISQAK